MKLAFSTLGCPSWSFEKILTEAERLGFSALEIRGIEGVMNPKKIPYFQPEQAEKTLDRLKEHGLTICGLGTSSKFHDPDTLEASVQEAEEAIDVCVQMKIPNIRVFGNNIPDPSRLEETAAQVVAGIKRVCAYARGKGVNVLLEVHGDFNTVEALTPVLDGLKECPEFGIIWDVAHSDRGCGPEFKPFYERIKPYLRHVHLKDHRHTPEGNQLCLTGEGDIPLGEILAFLEGEGYSGYYSFEWEKVWHPDLPEADVAFPQFVEFMKGHGF